MSKQPKKIRKVSSKTQKKIIEPTKKEGKVIPKVPLKTQKKVSKQPKKEGKASLKKESKIVKKAEKKIEKPIVKKDIPLAIISRPLKHITKKRYGKGFSRPELLSINIDPNKARRIGLRVDLKRTTKWDKNVDALKNWFTVPIVIPKKIQKTKKT